MKKFLFALVAGIPALVATNGAFAQNSINPEILEPGKNSAAIENVMPVSSNTAYDLGSTNARAVKDFTKTYKNVKGEQWSKIKDGFAAKFIADGITNLVYYFPNGKWSGSMKGYTEDRLPKDIRHQVRSSYYDYAITYVQEVETVDSKGIPTYIIHLQDDHNIKMLRISNGDMEIWKEYKKQ